MTDDAPDAGGEAGPTSSDAPEAETSTSSRTTRSTYLRWCLYPAYGLTVLGGGLALRFTLETYEWSILPVALAWGLLLAWHWLYGVSVRYRRPVLRYLSGLADMAMGGLLMAFALERAAPQQVALEGGMGFRNLSMPLIGAACATGLSTALVLLHALVVSRFVDR